jgi:WD40 repeat protein/serine/threonine protein kinase
VNESQVFGNALNFATPAERDAYLDKACAGNPRLRADVDALLRAHASDPGFLEQPADLTAEAVEGQRRGAEQPGLVVSGRYKLLELIGEGGMGSVWMAQQAEPVKRLVALKLIKPGMDSKTVLARFEAERQALALMDHPNIARVLDAGAAPDGRPFFVLELVKGRPITTFCDEQRLTLRQRLELFIPVCQAIQHAHTKGVIHRDIKPTNVLVALFDDRPVPKVIDFGVAKATGQQLTEQTLHTGFGAVVGTPEYMSPEQASFNQLDVDTRSDVYSLGVLLYELLAGSPPFSRKELTNAGLLEVLRVIRDQEPPRPSMRLSSSEGLPSLAANRGTEPRQLPALVRGDLDWIVMKALEKDRARRYETATGLAVDLQRYLADEPVQACPPSAAYRLRKFVRRHRVPVFAAVVVLAAVAAGVIGTAWQAVRATRERDGKQLALDDLGREQQRTTDALDRSRLLGADLAFDKGQLLGERGEPDLALLWLARSVRLMPESATELEAAARTSLAAWRRHVNSVQAALPHDGGTFAVGFAPDGTPLTMGWNALTRIVAVRRWDRVTGRPAAELQVTTPPGRFPRVPALRADTGRLLLGFSDQTDSVVRMVDLESGKTVWEADRTTGLYAAAAFSPDGRTVLVGLCIGDEQSPAATGTAQLLDAATGRPLGEPLAHNRPVFVAVFRPDGQGFVTTGGILGNGTEPVEARFWNLRGEQTRPPLKLPSLAMAAAFSPDGAWLLTGHWDRRARLWNLGTPGEPRVMRHEAPVIIAAFGLDGKTLLTGSFDGTVRVWDMSGRPLSQPLRHRNHIQAAAFSADSKSVLVGVRAENAARLWDLADPAPAPLPDRDLFPLASSPDRQTILALEHESMVRLRDATTGKPVGQPLPHPRPVFVRGLAINPGQRHACSSDRRRAVTLDVDNVARLWDTESGRPVAPLQPVPRQTDRQLFFGAAFSPDSRLVVTGSFDGTACVWDAETGRLLQSLSHEPSGPVFNFAFSPDGRSLLSAGADGYTRFWNPASGEQLGDPLAQGTVAFTVAISPDGHTAVTGGTDPNALLWDLSTRRRLSLSGHQASVNDLVFSPDGRFILSGSHDHTARLWDAATGKPIGPPLLHPGPVTRVAFGLDGRTVRTGTDEHVARSWPLPAAVTGTPEQLELWAEVVTGMELEPEGSVRILDTAEWQTRRSRLGSFEPLPAR